MRAVRVATLVAALLAGGAVSAQIPALPKSEPPAEAVRSPLAPAPPASSHSDSTPRGALYAYFTEARRADYVAAATHLDLSRIPVDQRATEGPILARHLKIVLDRNLWFDLDEISDRPEGNLDDGLDPNVELIGTIQTASGPVALRLRRGTDASTGLVWRFSPSLVDRIPGLYEEFGHGPLGDRIPQSLQRMRVLGLEAWQAIGLVLLTVLSWLAGWALTSVLAWAALPLARRTRTLVDDRLIETMRPPARWAATLIVFALSMRFLYLSVKASAWIDRLLVALAFVTAIISVAAIADAFARTMRERLEREGQKSGAGVVNVINRIVKTMLACIGMIGVLQALGFNVTGLLAGLGIGGIAVALAAQKTVENLLGGLTIMADRPVKIGDFCRLGTTAGTVEDLGFRSARIRTLEQSVIYVPNAELANVQIENLSERTRIRFYSVLNLRYETTPDQLRVVLVELRRLFIGHPKVAPDPLRIRFIHLGTSSLDVEIQAYIATSDVPEFYAIREDLLLRIMDVVAASGSGFAFPSQTVYMAKDGGLDPAETRAAEERIRSLRAQGKLPFPDFTPAEVSELSDRLDYPPTGSPSAVPPVTPS